MPTGPTILICKCAEAGMLAKPALESALQGASRSGRQLLVVNDLCELAARRDPQLVALANAKSVTIAACFPRAVKWLFSAAGAPLSPDAEILNLRLLDSLAVASRITAPETRGERPITEPAAADPQTAALGSGPPANTGWSAWFPVIDFERCNHCMQCLNFCLFGVFGVDAERHLAVTAPENCKANCPACSRVCPEAAIVFPKYPNSPINGDEVTTADLNREGMKADLSSLLGGDLYAELKKRRLPNGPRFSKERDPAEAMRERERYLALAQSLAGLPPDVVASLLRETKLPLPQDSAQPDPAKLQ